VGAVGIAFAVQIEWLESAQNGFVWFSALAVVLGLAAWFDARPILAPAFAEGVPSEDPAPRPSRAQLVFLRAQHRRRVAIDGLVADGA